MSLLETIHELAPGWVLFPVICFFIAFLLEDYAGADFKKTKEEENEQHTGHDN